MKISARGRYALAATITMAADYRPGACMTLPAISEKLGVSKIYLEQVFALLRRADLVLSIKGPQGGYELARPPREMTTYDVLEAVELTLFKQNDNGLIPNDPAVENAITALVFTTLDRAIEEVLRQTTLADLLQEWEKQKGENGLMFFI